MEDARLREMLQALLIDRFQLKFHRETKSGDVYLLERTDKTLALRQSESLSNSADTTAGGRSFSSIGYADRRWVVSSSSMPQVAKFASDYVLQVPVLDRTV